MIMVQKTMHVGKPEDIQQEITKMKDEVLRLQHRIETFENILKDKSYNPAEGTIIIEFADTQVEAVKRLGIRL